MQSNIAISQSGLTILSEDEIQEVSGGVPAAVVYAGYVLLGLGVIAIIGVGVGLGVAYYVTHNK